MRSTFSDLQEDARKIQEARTERNQNRMRQKKRAKARKVRRMETMVGRHQGLRARKRRNELNDTVDSVRDEALDKDDSYRHPAELHGGFWTTDSSNQTGPVDNYRNPQAPSSLESI
jgi:hypothetical protein